MAEIAIAAAAFLVAIGRRNRLMNAGQAARDEGLLATQIAFSDGSDGWPLGKPFKVDGRVEDLAALHALQEVDHLIARSADVAKHPRRWRREIDEEEGYLDPLVQDELMAAAMRGVRAN